MFQKVKLNLREMKAAFVESFTHEWSKSDFLSFIEHHYDDNPNYTKEILNEMVFNIIGGDNETENLSQFMEQINVNYMKKPSRLRVFSSEESKND